MKTTTVIVNNTSDELKVKVGGHQHNAEVASIDKGGKWDLHVFVNETYREFRLQDASGKKVAIVSSDDCCDNECITIKEAADDLHGQFEVHRVPRRQQQQNFSQQEEISSTGASSKPTWFGWLRQLWTQKWHV